MLICFMFYAPSMCLMVFIYLLNLFRFFYYVVLLFRKKKTNLVHEIYLIKGWIKIRSEKTSFSSASLSQIQFSFTILISLFAVSCHLITQQTNKTCRTLLLQFLLLNLLHRFFVTNAVKQQRTSSIPFQQLMELQQQQIYNKTSIVANPPTVKNVQRNKQHLSISWKMALKKMMISVIILKSLKKNSLRPSKRTRKNLTKAVVVLSLLQFKTITTKSTIEVLLLSLNL